MSTPHHIQYKLDELLYTLQFDDAPAGGAVVVYQAGHCIAQSSVGQATKNSDWSVDTLSLNFSAGKGILATLVHVMVSRGYLCYDRPIAHDWHNFATNGKANITLRQVMTHQAGLFDVGNITQSGTDMLNWPLMLARVEQMPIATADISPKDRTTEQSSAYSALVYGWVLGGLIEAVTGSTLQLALQTFLTQPLGIAEQVYFGVPDSKVKQVAQPPRRFLYLDADDNHTPPAKPKTKGDSSAITAKLQTLPSYVCWQALVAQQAGDQPKDHLRIEQINRLYFDPRSINKTNYKAALQPSGEQAFDYYWPKVLSSIIPAAGAVASAHALATIYALLANKGRWGDQQLIDPDTFAQLSQPLHNGVDHVMPAAMQWRLGYHRLFSVCHTAEQGFGHLGYNGASAWCDPARHLAVAYVHNVDTTMLFDIRQFAITEAILGWTSQHSRC